MPQTGIMSNRSFKQVEQMQVPEGTGPGVRRSKRTVGMPHPLQKGIWQLRAFW